MSENVDQSFPKGHDDVLKYLVLHQTQTYSVNCHRVEKLGYIHIEEAFY